VSGLGPAVLTGKPVMRGTRLSVDFVIGLMADGWAEFNILQSYPGISHQDLACGMIAFRGRLHRKKDRPKAALYS
jgi:uncharacterized protein (DUF433 family)